MAPHTLFYAPGACSLSSHIALREARLTFDLAKVDLRARKLTDGGDWLALNPKGYVPALRLPDGQLLTESAVIMQYIADQRPETQLAPAAGTLERYRLQEWLLFIATELHHAMTPLHSSLAGDEYKQQLLERLGGRFAMLARGLVSRPFLMGEQFTVADGYAFYVLRAWQHAHKQDLARWSELADYYRRLAARPTIATALEVEGLPHMSRDYQRYQPQAYAALRIVAGGMFLCHGLGKIFGWLGHAMPTGSQLWFGGLIELVCGALIALGLFTRPAALLASGTMAVAYFQYHWKLQVANWAFLPAVNEGELAVLYCFVFLVFAIQGAGIWSLDRRR